MNLVENFIDLVNEKKRIVHFELCRNALEVLNKYFSAIGKIEYVETVVGAKHTVDKKLPGDAFLSAENGKDMYKSEKRFVEPIVALQDEDISFPENIEFAYYAIYNLFRKYALGAKVDDWLIVNQALSSEIEDKKWDGLLGKAIKKADE